MKARHSIYILLPLCASLATGSCTDEAFISNATDGNLNNTICFDVSSGFGNNTAATRSGDCVTDSDGLAPMVFSEGGDTLYLHRYVAAEAERTTGHNSDVATRSTPVNTTADFKSINGESGFRVIAMFTSNDEAYFPLSTAVPLTTESSDDVWHVANPIHYWPDERELRFNAFAPASAEDLLEQLHIVTTDDITFHYTVPVSTETPRRDAEIQPDIMLATTVCTHTFGENHSDLAPLNFRHALSAIKFAVRDVTIGEIVAISIKGVAGSGSCTFNPENGFQWSDRGENADYTQTFNYQTTEPASVPTLENATVINDEMPEKTFMLIPQTIPDDAVLEITFKKSNGETKTLRGKLKTADIPLWEAGKEYIYTLSTSSENWTYIFKVTGSVQEKNDKAPSKGSFSDNDDNIIVNATVTKGSYYKVLSYRYRTNNPSIAEPVAWTATPTGGTNHSDNTKIQEYIDRYETNIQMYLTPEEWFPDEKTSFSGTGSSTAVKYDVVFAPQYVASDLEGDWEMRAKEEIGSQENPIDLSKRNGGLNVRNTANCYVVNRGGWYAIPLYYGNSITNGTPNPNSYKYLKGAHAEHGYSALVNFVNHTGEAKGIQQPEIVGAEDATLVWEDAYGIIPPDEVKLKEIEGEQYVVFHILHEDLQQANAIIAVLDKKIDKNSTVPIDEQANIMWSWHIWISDHWVDDNLVLNRGEVQSETWEDDLHGTPPISSFTAAPCNLGWCDAKNVGYLKRDGQITFTQEKPGKPEERPVHTLYVEQRDMIIDYWIGNNAYYQWGRKDPMVGFINEQNETKNTYGPLEYDIADAGTEINIEEAIKHPHLLYIRKNETNFTSNDWLAKTTNYYNLWNNYSGAGNFTTSLNEAHEPNQWQTPIHYTDFAYSAVKTVYDPSPAGYVVPPTTFFNIFTKARVHGEYSDVFPEGVPITAFNGTVEPMKDQKGNIKAKYYIWKGYATRSATGDLIILTPTGVRWDKIKNATQGWPPGGNMNPFIIYLWSNATTFDESAINGNGHTAFSLCIGNDGGPVNQEYVMTTHFNGRKSMARPIRCIKEYQH